MNIGYIVVREDLDDPLIKSQVLDILESLNNSGDHSAADLIWFYRVDYFFRAKSRKKRILRKDLDGRNIKVHFLPFIGPAFPVAWWLLPFVCVQWFFAIILLWFFKGFKQLHCRSYHAGLIGLLVKKIINVDYIFDPRSPMPEENVSSGRWKMLSNNYKVWKLLEAKIVAGSKRTVLISECQKDLYKGPFDSRKFVTIPNSYPRSFDDSYENEIGPLSYSYDFAYVGSFGHWNKAEDYVRFLKGINELSKRSYSMLFLVRGDGLKSVLFAADKVGLSRGLFDAYSLPQKEVKEALKMCRFGLYFMKNEDPRLGVKTVEYIRSGLKVIVSDTIKGAANVVEENDLGVVWDYSNEGLKKVDEYCASMPASALDDYANQINFAVNHFSPSAISNKLLSECYSYEL